MAFFRYIKKGLKMYLLIKNSKILFSLPSQQLNFRDSQIMCRLLMLVTFFF